MFSFDKKIAALFHIQPTYLTLLHTLEKKSSAVEKHFFPWKRRVCKAQLESAYYYFIIKAD